MEIVMIMLGLVAPIAAGVALLGIIWRDRGRRQPPRSSLVELQSRQAQLDELGRELEEFEQEVARASGRSSSATPRSPGHANGRSP